MYTANVDKCFLSVTNVEAVCPVHGPCIAPRVSKGILKSPHRSWWQILLAVAEVDCSVSPWWQPLSPQLPVCSSMQGRHSLDRRQSVLRLTSTGSHYSWRSRSVGLFAWCEMRIWAANPPSLMPSKPRGSTALQNSTSSLSASSRTDNNTSLDKRRLRWCSTEDANLRWMPISFSTIFIAATNVGNRFSFSR